jgi:hypothetical protein
VVFVFALEVLYFCDGALDVFNVLFIRRSIVAGDHELLIYYFNIIVSQISLYLYYIYIYILLHKKLGLMKLVVTSI